MKAFFERVSADEYEGVSCIAKVEFPYAVMVKALGEPHKNGDEDYPDDDYKTDVCWGIRLIENPEEMVVFWNYKNGPAYNDGVGTIEELDYFSMWYPSEALGNRVIAYIEGVAKGMSNE